MKENLILKEVTNNYLTHTINNKGITVVSLVITIIILLILTVISIQAIRNTGLFENAKVAKQITENAQINEENILVSYDNNINNIYSSRSNITKKDILYNGGTITQNGTFELQKSIKDYDLIIIESRNYYDGKRKISHTFVVDDELFIDQVGIFGYDNRCFWIDFYSNENKFSISNVHEEYLYRIIGIKL